MLINWLIFFVSMLLLLLYRGTAVAFVYSFKYRESDRVSGNVAEKIATNFYKEPGLFLTSVGLMTLILVTVSSLAGYWAIQQLSGIPDGWPKICLLIILLLVAFCLFGFLLPQYLFGRNPDKMLVLFVIPIYIVGVILIPLTRLLLFFFRKILHLIGQELDDLQLSYLWGCRELMDPKLRPALSVEKPDIKEKDLKIFKNALEFSNVRVRDCIVPRTEIVSVEIGDRLQDLLNSFVKSGKTKVIVYKEDLDHIVGYVHSSDLFRPAARENWTGCIRQIPIVPESMSAQRMMQIFMQQKKSIAVVADEFGGTTGIISLEDLFEEIFGDIEDEHDVVTFTARETTDGEYVLSARMEIEKVNELFNLNLPESDDYLTIGGFILFHYQDFPKVGQVVTIGKFNFTILKSSVAKIDLVKLKVTP